MTKKLSAGALIAESWRGAARALVPAAPWLALFALASGLYTASLRAEGPAVTAFLLAAAAFLAGVQLSLAIYRTLLGGKPGTLVSLAHANLAVAAGFGFIAFFIVFFVGAFGVMMLQMSGLVDLATDPDAAAISAAQANLYATPYGAALILVTGAGTAALAYIALRLMVFAPATVADGQARVFRTWGLTKGQVLPLGLAASVTTALPLAAALGLAHLVGPFLPETLAGQFGRGALSILFLTPCLLAGHGLATAAYARLKPADTEASSDAG